MLKNALILFGIALFMSKIGVGQNQYTIAACDLSTKSKKFVGERLRLPLPKDASVKNGKDVDYHDYYIGYGDKNSRVWLSGIFGPNATSGEVSDKWLSVSSDVVRKTWTFGEIRGVDVKGRLPTGNYWRYFGQFGESFKYYDVSVEASAYFDRIIGQVCYQEWKP